ncbi:copper homeostasis protein CutC [Fertoebacter nigrum]|uniref:PF03932 family protein CutC n=1 Tax=Fertoeibacter niger TaxID=2656921 RepID=A0A8X8KPR7_9RHOB|nr:copper homeostasis protein CutC [Fertoeibacter niger]NUB45171.1 copper homeostasis protein CutC [Fertoeibacter niger]
MLLEVCVDTVAGLEAAVAGGADRIELCAALELGGLTPSAGLMAAAAGCGLPVFAMIRPRAGDFAFSAAEVAVMRADIRAARAAGLAGVVLGATRGRALDHTVLAELVAEARGMGLTLHRAFDLCGPDFRAAIDLAVQLGFQRILTSGGALTAPQGAAALAGIFAHAAGRIAVMPGAGITAETIGALRHLPLAEVHASCSAAFAADTAAVALGFAAPQMRQTDASRVRALKSALTG